MKTDQMDALAQLFKQSMESHPVFSNMDADKMQDMSKDFFKSFEAMYGGQSHPFAEWTGTWIKYQTDLAQV